MHEKLHDNEDSLKFKLSTGFVYPKGLGHQS